MVAGRSTSRGLRAHHLVQPLVIVVAVSMAAAWLFALLAAEIAEKEMAQLDALGGKWATSMRSPMADVFFSAATWGGTAFILLPITMITAWYLWERRGRRVVVPVVIAPAIAPLLTGVIKLAYGRERPTGAMVKAMGSSFPSGHTTAATAVALTLCYVLVQERLAPKTLIAVAIAFALLVGASRIYLGAHWSSDVLGGWAVGTAIAGASAALFERARKLEQATV
jgi:membrane-associated phospholipid phosphatase